MHTLIRYGTGIKVQGVVCYNRATAMSEAVYICDYNSRFVGEVARVYQSDGHWNGTMHHTYMQ